MAMKKPPVVISPSGRVPGRASEPSRDGFALMAASELLVEYDSGT